VLPQFQRIYYLPLCYNFVLYYVHEPWTYAWDLRSSGILRSIKWHFRSYVSGQPIDPIFKHQAVTQSSWTAWPLNMGPTGCPKSLYGNILRCVRSQNSSDLIYIVREGRLKSNVILGCLSIYFYINLHNSEKNWGQQLLTSVFNSCV
jgi:hypothetical protein